MLTFIRFTALFIVIFSVAMFTGCSEGSPFAGKQYDVERPLVLPEASSARPKIAAFGDSLTAGFGLAETESYPYLLQQRLDADGFSYEVINAGVSGDTSLGGVERIDWVLEQEGLEILILELGANDLLRGVPVERMKSNLDRIIAKTKEKNVKVLLCGMLAPPSMGNDYQREYTAAFPALADKYGVAYLPFLLEGIALNRQLNQADGIHPNAEGTRIMSENVYKELKPLLIKKN